MVHTSDQGDVSEADLLLPFELATLEGDYREYQMTRRNNRFASMQRLPDLWRVFTQLDACWRAGLDDMRRITSARRYVAPLAVHSSARANAHLGRLCCSRVACPKLQICFARASSPRFMPIALRTSPHLQPCGFKRMTPQAGERTRGRLKKRKRPVCSKASRTYTTITRNLANGRTRRSHPSRSSPNLQSPIVT
jgi:hypothetical protein